MIKASVVGDVALINKFLQQLPGFVQASSFESALRPAAKVVEKRVRELTPRSSETGSTSKWSRPTKAKRAGELPLWKLTATKIWRPRAGKPTVALVGYQWPKGNKAHFAIESKNKYRRQVWWGVRTSNYTTKIDVLKRAIDETKEQTRSAFTAAVKKAVEKRLEQEKIRARIG